MVQAGNYKVVCSVVIVVMSSVVAVFASTGIVEKSDNADKMLYEWSLVTDSPGWTGRGMHTALIFNNNVWVMGGMGADFENPFPADVWWSSDCINWVKAVEGESWLYRAGHAAVVYDNRLWVMGGATVDLFNPNLNDVWASGNGFAWSQMTSSAAWHGRNEHTSVVYDGSMWIIGGEFMTINKMEIEHTNLNDVWRSEDGINWVQATENAPWAARCMHSSVVFDNKIWVIGGNALANGPSTYFNDVWFSEDGTNWTQATSGAPWTPRAAHSSVVYDNKIWVIGGGQYDPAPDSWYSSDGISWTQAENASYAYALHQSVILNDTIYNLGGNEIWRLNTLPEGEGEAEGENEGEGEAPDTVTIHGTGRVEDGGRVVLRLTTPPLVGNVTVEWYKDDVLMEGMTALEYVIPIVSMTDAGVYYVIVTDESKTVYQSPPFVLTVLPEGSMPVSGALTVGVLVALLAGLGIRRQRIH